MKDNQIQQIQQSILDLLAVFQTICRKYNLTYFAIGGTCLGAVRHKGFIPWDDDMDVAMPYEDYKKFLEIISTEIQAPYALLHPKTSQHWSQAFIKLHNTQTTFIEDGRVPYPDSYTGVFLDIMPVFGLPKGNLKQKKCAKKLNFLLHQNIAFRFAYREQISWRRKCFWLTSLFYRVKKPFYYFLDKIESDFSKYPFHNSNKIIFGWRARPYAFWRSSNYKQVFDYCDFSQVLEVPFENTTIAIPMGYDHYLRADFGDYMTLPPEEKRCPRHGNAIIDLKRPYSYYQRRDTK